MNALTDDEPIPDAVMNVALAATQILTVADALAQQFGPEAVRAALLVAFAEFAARDLGEQGMLEKLNTMVAAITENSTVEAAVHKWLR
jgi:hypothetical protein